MDEIVIDIENNCINKCIFCSKNYNHNDKVIIYEKVNFNDLKNQVLFNLDKGLNFNICGSEPFNYSKLYDLLLLIKELSNKKITIKTSGVIGQKINLNLFKIIDRIMLPCYSLFKDNLNSIYGNNKAYYKYNNFLSTLKSNYNGKLLFHSVVLKNNYLEFPKILYFLHKMFFVKKLVLYYPIKAPWVKVDNYYDISISRDLVKSRYKDFVLNGMFELINFEKSLEYYEKNNFKL